MDGPKCLVSGSDFVWSDLPPDEEAARVAAKLSHRQVIGDPTSSPIDLTPHGFKFQTDHGGLYELISRVVEPTKVDGVPYLVTRQYGARHVATGKETWAPLATEGPTRPDVTVNTVRDLCGIIALERKVAALEAQNRALQARVAELESVRVAVRRA